MQCEEWTDANSKLFKEVHDEAVHKNSYKRKLYELISASLGQWNFYTAAALLHNCEKQAKEGKALWVYLLIIENDAKLERV